MLFKLHSWLINIMLTLNHCQIIHLMIYIGSHWATYGIHNDQFETNIKLKHGRNDISLLSVTVGLQVSKL